MTREALPAEANAETCVYTGPLISSIRAGAVRSGSGSARRGGRLRGARRRARAGRVPAGAVSPVSVYIARINYHPQRRRGAPDHARVSTQYAGGLTVYRFTSIIRLTGYMAGRFCCAWQRGKVSLTSPPPPAPGRRASRPVARPVRTCPPRVLPVSGLTSGSLSPRPRRSPSSAVRTCRAECGRAPARR